ncbi:MAG: hypothetical protein CMJ32_09695 [Phycisphaerae bacterium]|nr:hypothetical protein [Phycisphaerae bacterium]
MTLVAPTRFLIDFAANLIDDIDESKWADRCGTTINHPAFILGHTAYYAGVCMQILGSDIELSEQDASLYQHGAECADEPTWYPGKAESIAAFNERINAAADFMESLDESVFATSSEETFFSDRFPTLGGVAAFMFMAHIPFHLGQLSAWRRVAGMGAAS